MQNRQALIVIDMQYDFSDVAPPEFQTTLRSSIQRTLSQARELDLPVVHVLTQYEPDKSNWPSAWTERNHLRCIRGTPGVQILKGLEPAPNEQFIPKTRYTALYETKLDSWLKTERIEGITLCGYSSDVCVRMTAMDAYNRGYPITILVDSVLPERASLSDSLHSLKWLTNARVLTSDEWFHSLDT